jgi:hypothetical protein
MKGKIESAANIIVILFSVIVGSVFSRIDYPLLLQNRTPLKPAIDPQAFYIGCTAQRRRMPTAISASARKQ